jgi:hypothetical protein
MGMPQNPITLTPAQVEELNTKLSDARHSVNNCLSLIVAATELIRRKPDMTPRMLETVSQQPDKITGELRKLSDYFEQTLGITRD